ncbi:MAG: Na/Pi cotransporter family protein [Candidatus Bipolaricaulia bacterium]
MKFIFGVVGGLALFLYGVGLMGTGLQKIAGERMKRILASLTTSPWTGTLIGAGVTAIIQSSSATTVIVIGFVNAGLMTLTQAIGVIFGANIGTTVTAQLLAFKITKYALPILSVGFAIQFVCKKDVYKYFGLFLLGFGVLFLGLNMMTGETKQIVNNESVRQAFIRYSENPLLGLLTGMIITFIVQSSSATVGLVLVLASSGLITLRGAIPLILGDNIGTTVTALIASLGVNRSAKRAAVAHLLFNVIGAVIVLVLLRFYLRVVLYTSSDVARQVANAHTLFNIINTLLFLPFAGLYAKLIKLIVPGEDRILETGSKYVDEGLLRVPSVAIGQTIKEIARMLDITHQMFNNAMSGVFEVNIDRLAEVAQQEEVVDNLQLVVTEYVMELSQRQLSVAESEMIPMLLHSVNDVERIGDHAENLVGLAERKLERKLPFTAEALDSLQQLHFQLDHMIEQTSQALQTDDHEMAQAVLEQEEWLNDMSDKFQRDHMERLEQGRCNVRSGLVFLDIISNFEKIGDHLRNVAEAVLGRYHRESAYQKS